MEHTPRLPLPIGLGTRANARIAAHAMTLEANTSLPITDVARVVKIFREKEWPLPGPNSVDSGATLRPDMFERCLQLIERLSQIERKLFLELLEDYVTFTYFNYPSLLRQALTQCFQDSCFGTPEQIVYVPIKSPKDQDSGAAKSGTQLPYDALNLQRSGHLPAVGATHSAYDSVAGVTSTRGRPTNVIMLDDFSGTGNTVLKCIHRFDNEHRRVDDRVFVVLLVAQKRAMEAIRSVSVAYVGAGVIRERGISDSSRFPVADKPIVLKVMAQVEERLGVPAKYRYGFGGSEALVTLRRTPNNTFPVFWWWKDAQGQEWPAPFPR